MEEIMLPDIPGLRRSRTTAVFLAIVGALVFLITVYSVRPTASRFDRAAPRQGFSQMPLAYPAQAMPLGHDFDYSLVFPEQPSSAIR
jgi:hypothetical protein